MIKIHREIWKETRRPVIDISRHIIIFCLNIVGLWVMIHLTDFLFPDIPLAVKALAYLSEIGIIVHFAKDNF
jgi:hypothetical protein